MIDLATWNLTLPVGEPAVTIETAQLLGGYRDNYFHAESGALFFWVPVDGSTTANAVYPRSELRETFADGKLRNWTYPSADNYLSANLAVTQVPSTGKVVIGQIHAKDSTSPLLKLEYQYKVKTGTANIVAKVRAKPTDAEGTVYTLLSGVKLNQRFTYVINLSPTGLLSILLNDTQWSKPLSTTWKAKPLYFKVGVYAQDNAGAGEAGSATFYNLKPEHRALTTK
ncbi:polysaccharide lyase family 7 protein [Pseudomonas sp. UL073]|uniref:Polysaccharide lyase family 7 protein n=1 Tax=Zestomonas insulae TaxID=2809017 RepID=A0ABS2IK15_9GAMM|nr:polysaccharide lyase family 7 protein [Pseudomonas insulae]MBM7062317.1 polysaccharide lyase family 7 protein [Pseudomonas insulae]